MVRGMHMIAVENLQLETEIFLTTYGLKAYSDAKPYSNSRSFITIHCLFISDVNACMNE